MGRWTSRAAKKASFFAATPITISRLGCRTPSSPWSSFSTASNPRLAPMPRMPTTMARLTYRMPSRRCPFSSVALATFHRILTPRRGWMARRTTYRLAEKDHESEPGDEKPPAFCSISGPSPPSCALGGDVKDVLPDAPHRNVREGLRAPDADDQHGRRGFLDLEAGGAHGDERPSRRGAGDGRPAI